LNRVINTTRLLPDGTNWLSISVHNISSLHTYTSDMVFK